MESLALKKPHWESLTPATQDAFHLLSKIEMIQGFYLAGGTGLALHFGHRFSVDLDFFSNAANDGQDSLVENEKISRKEGCRSGAQTAGRFVEIIPTAQSCIHK